VPVLRLTPPAAPPRRMSPHSSAAKAGALPLAAATLSLAPPRRPPRLKRLPAHVPDQAGKGCATRKRHLCRSLPDPLARREPPHCPLWPTSCSAGRHSENGCTQFISHIAASEKSSGGSSAEPHEPFIVGILAEPQNLLVLVLALWALIATSYIL
jgi:hypothetical protein